MFAPPVAAADLPVKAAPAPVVVGSWTGYYVGVHGGRGWDDTQIPIPFSSPINLLVEAKIDGPLAGVQVGANWQSGNVVLGAEADVSWTFLRSNTNLSQAIPASTDHGSLVSLSDRTQTDVGTSIPQQSWSDVVVLGRMGLEYAW